MNLQKIDLEIWVYMSITTMSAQVEQLIIDATSFQPDSDIKYSKPKINKSGGKSVNLVMSRRAPPSQFDTAYADLGVNEYVDDMSGKKTYNMALQFPNEEYKNDETSQFLDAMISLENKIKADAVENCKDWFGKTKLSTEVVDALFHPMLQYPKDPNTGEPNMERSPTLKIKLDYRDNKFNCEIYDVDSQPIFPRDDVISTPQSSQGYKRSNGHPMWWFWFANGKFGVTWRLEQAVVKPRASFKGRCMIKLSASDAEKLKSQPVEEDEVQDSEDETEAVVEADGAPST